MQLHLRRPARVGFHHHGHLLLTLLSEVERGRGARIAAAHGPRQRLGPMNVAVGSVRDRRQLLEPCRIAVGDVEGAGQEARGAFPQLAAGEAVGIGPTRVQPADDLESGVADDGRVYVGGRLLCAD